MITDIHEMLLRTRRKIDGLGKGINIKLNRPPTGIEKAKGVRVLVYHGICTSDPFRFNTLFITEKKLERHLQLYKKYFNLISLDDLYTNNYDHQKFSLCLTFDDGFANNYHYVLPLLEKYEVPACFFITAIRSEGKDCLWNDVLSIAGITGPQKLVFNKEEYTKARGKYWSASGRLLNDVLRYESFKARQQVIDLLTAFTAFKENVQQDYWLQVTTDQISKLAKSKWVTIGSHSSWHNDLAKSSTDDLKADLKKSKSFLENSTCKEIKALAFPYGSYTRDVIEEAKAIGYTQLLATEFLYPEDKYDPALKERLTINPFISSIHQVHANISGHY